MQGVWVPSLVRELGSHINLRQKQYCNEFKKDFKNGPHQKKRKRKKEYSGIRGREKARMIPRA